ncbi:acetylglutamate kinase [Natronospira proteinivora]|uniref:Acetylglutamate kinase n=1 Tax=Natronospira proteinivora TaxID=1807133 RepID=A0ABT1GA45_9GAMM|nr:acetylglutamate kinase [Natronospira proteinivora]MCP1727780.1 acetylglutamate kinase [Natronospira proteinivora]
MSPHLNPWRTLRSAARYVHQFRDQIFVIKLGGELLDGAEQRRRIAEQLAVLWQFSIPLVIVHGGGGDLDRLCHSQGVAVEKKAGRRITSPEVLEAAKMRFVGSTQTNLLADLRSAGLSPVGLSGVDAGLVTAEKRPPVPIDGENVDFGEVGDITTIRPAIIHQLLAAGHLPVIAPLTADDDGRVFNTNADTLAASLAASLKAEKLFYLLETAGLLSDINDPASLLTEADPETLKNMIADGAIQGGMQPKAESVIQALAGGVARVHLVSGLDPDALLEEVFTNEGSGTMVHQSNGIHQTTAFENEDSKGSALDQEAVAHVG